MHAWVTGHCKSAMSLFLQVLLSFFMPAVGCLLPLVCVCLCESLTIGKVCPVYVLACCLLPILAVRYPHHLIFGCVCLCVCVCHSPLGWCAMSVFSLSLVSSSSASSEVPIISSTSSIRDSTRSCNSIWNQNRGYGNVCMLVYCDKQLVWNFNIHVTFNIFHKLVLSGLSRFI